MKSKVLFVDDEPNVLDGIKRQMRRHVVVETALSGEEGLRQIEESGPFVTVVSDMRMPKMDGAEFLKRVRAVTPDTVRILLTGQTDLDSAVSAVNDGNIFRFLCKPCPQETLVQALDDADKQYRMVTLERELLEKTLMGSVKVLTEVLSLASPLAFSRAAKIKDYVSHMAGHLGLADVWIFEIAAMLSQLGCITLPTETLNKLYVGQKVCAQEREMYDAHPETGARLLEQIPRMEEVAAIIRAQRGAPAEAPEVIRVGGEMLHTALAVDHMVAEGMEVQWALTSLRKAGGFDPLLLDALMEFQSAGNTTVNKALQVSELQPDMILDEPVCTQQGSVVLGKGEKLTSVQIERLINFNRGAGLREPIQVRLPPDLYLKI